MHFIPEEPFNDGKKVYIRPRRDQDGINWVLIRNGERKGPWQKQTSFRGKGSLALRQLDEAGFNLQLTQFEELANQVNRISKFLPATSFFRPGWSDGKFALPNGAILSSAQRENSFVRFAPRSDLVGSKGDQENWLKEVAGPLSGCRLPEFCLMAAFAAPLLRFAQTPFNFGFELSGPPASGKTTLAMICASVAGPIGGQNGCYAQTLNSTVNSLDAIMPDFNDLPLILEEANLLTIGAAKLGHKKMADLVFRLADGRSKRRYGKQAGADARFVWLMTTNLGWPHQSRYLDPDTAQAVADRLITLPVPSAKEGGIFGKGGLHGDSVSSVSQRVVAAASRSYGTAIAHFIRSLQSKFEADGEETVAKEVENSIDEFRRAAEERVYDADPRLVRAFGIVYAAGKFAISCGALPRNFSAKKSSMSTLRRHVHARETIKSPLQALTDLATGEEMVDLREREFKTADRGTIEDATCVLHGSRGRTELILTAEHMAALEVEVPDILKDPGVLALLRRDDRRLTMYRNLVPGERQRVYVFRYDELQKRVAGET